MELEVELFMEYEEKRTEWLGGVMWTPEEKRRIEAHIEAVNQAAPDNAKKVSVSAFIRQAVGFFLDSNSQ